MVEKSLTDCGEGAVVERECLRSTLFISAPIEPVSRLMLIGISIALPRKKCEDYPSNADNASFSASPREPCFTRVRLSLSEQNGTFHEGLFLRGKAW